MKSKIFPEIVDAIVEVPKGCRNKHGYDKATGI
jgi:hypothetical protein